MPTINADADGSISVTLEFRYLEKKLQEISQKLDQVLQKLDQIEQECGKGGQMGASAKREHAHEMG